MLDPNARKYLILIAVQSACAFVILYNIRLAFRLLLDSLGTAVAASPVATLQLVLAALVGQACYWWRQRHVGIPGAFRGLVLGHLFAFAGRIGFIFGGALFSLYYLRHVPELALGYPQLVLQSALLLAILFALYCYTLELERLGAAMQLRALQPKGHGRT